ncbi:MAG: C39 family peptidase [Ruminococcus sp.]
MILNTQLTGSSGYQYKYVTNESTFNFVLKLLEYLQGGVEAVKNALYNVFHWTDFLTGGTSGSDTYIGNIDATGDIITYDTVGKGVKKVVYYNQGEDPWATMSYGASTIKASGCGPTSLAIVISTLTGQTVTPEMTCAFSIANGEYIYGLGTCHSFPMNAAHHWGLNCERVGKDRMGDIVNALKDGKMVVEICEAYTITGSGSGHFIVLTVLPKMAISPLLIVPVGNVLEKCTAWKRLLLTVVTWQMEPFGSLENERWDYGQTFEILVAYGTIFFCIIGNANYGTCKHEHAEFYRFFPDCFLG